MIFETWLRRKGYPATEPGFDIIRTEDVEGEYYAILAIDLGKLQNLKIWFFIFFGFGLILLPFAPVTSIIHFSFALIPVIYTYLRYVYLMHWRKTI